MRTIAVYLIIIAVVLMFLADATNSMLRKLGFSLRETSVSVYVRGVLDVLFLLMVLGTVRGRRVLALIVLLVVCYGTGTFVLFLQGTDTAQSHIIGNLIQIQKLTFAFICAAVLFTYFSDPADRKRLFRVYETIVIIQIITILVGFAFSIEFFQSYHKYRFGYNGLIPAVNETTGFFLLAVFYFSNKLFRERVLDLRGLAWIAIISASLLTGSRACVFGVVFTAAGYACIHLFRRYRLPRRYFVLALVIPLVLASVLLMAYSRDVPGETKDYLTSQYRRIEKKYPQNPFLFVLTSGRTLKARTLAEQAETQWTTANYLFGGWDLYDYQTEIDPVDVFALIGGVGAVLFYVAYFRLWGVRRSMSFYAFFPFIVWMGISCSAGHLVSSAVNGMYLAIFLLSVHHGTELQSTIEPDRVSEIA